MDREMREEYLIVIQAKDMGGHMGGLSGTTTVTITLTDINDNPPKFTKGKSHTHLQTIYLQCVVSHLIDQILYFPVPVGL